MDPWQPCPAANPISSTEGSGDADVVDLVLHNGEKNHEQDHFNEINSDHSKEELSFGDDFHPFVKLPDSQQYLESLENKLKSIQKGGRKGANADSILRSLGQTKESCMLKLLSNSVEKLTVEGEIFDEIKINPLLKKLAPEKQALSAEELVHLLKADQLEIILGGSSTDEETSVSTLEEPTTGVVEAELKLSEEEAEKDKENTEIPSTEDLSQKSE